MGMSVTSPSRVLFQNIYKCRRICVQDLNVPTPNQRVTHILTTNTYIAIKNAVRSSADVDMAEEKSFAQRTNDNKKV